MEELIRLKIQSYGARMKLVDALNEAGYGTRIEEVRGKFPYSTDVSFYVVVYENIKEPE